MFLHWLVKIPERGESSLFWSLKIIWLIVGECIFWLDTPPEVLMWRGEHPWVMCRSHTSGLLQSIRKARGQTRPFHSCVRTNGGGEQNPKQPLRLLGRKGGGRIGTRAQCVFAGQGTQGECTNPGTEAEPQQIVAQGLLSCLQYPVPTKSSTVDLIRATF